jgi:hypothetical protein
MISAITILAVTTLSLIGLLHFYWAMGGMIGMNISLPTEDGVRLMNPGKIATVIVGVALFGFAFIAYMLYFYDLSSSAYQDYFIISGWILSGIFIL